MSMIYAIACIIALLGLAKHGRRGRRKMGKYLRGSVDEDLALSTLASRDVVSQSFGGVVNERTLVSSVVAKYSQSNWTPGTNEGPILVGLAHSDYSAAEIEAWVENDGSWNETDLVQQEVANRKIRRVGIFEIPALEGQAVVLNEGRSIKTKMNWILNQGQTIELWAMNLGTSALAGTTSPNINVSGHANLWPR